MKSLNNKLDFFGHLYWSVLLATLFGTILGAMYSVVGLFLGFAIWIYMTRFHQLVEVTYKEVFVTLLLKTVAPVVLLVTYLVWS